MSTIRCDNFGPSAGGTTYSARGIAKAWVNFNGTGTIAARDSLNVTSLTDVGTGECLANTTSAMNNGNYSFSGQAAGPTLGILYSRGSYNAAYRSTTSFGAGVLYQSTFGGAGTFADCDYVDYKIHGDLA